jgi:uncharacterized DUF497 family protein
MFAPKEFEWDEAKAASNIRKHRISFGFAVRVARDPRRLDYNVSRAEDGEARRKVVGLIRNRLYRGLHNPRRGGMPHHLRAASKFLREATL